MKQNLLRAALGSMCAIALAATYHRTNSAEAMAQAATNFLAMLPAEAQAKATFGFEDKERLNWHFIPRERKGLPLKEMDAGQRALAGALLSTGLSSRGYAKVGGVLSLEPILRDQEKDTKGRRDAAGYFYTIFGKPSGSSNWGWRFEGHHVALNYNVINGRTVATSPTFFGANPAEVKEGPRKGFRALAREEDLARELLHSLDARQKALAVLSNEAPKDITTGANVRVGPIDPKGIAASKLTKKQNETLMALIAEYAGNMPEDLEAARMEGVRKGGTDKIHFAWMGGPDRGQPHYYRVQGPTFLIEYDNTQNNANHIHSVWRDFNGDFGADLLKAHYEQFHLARR